MVTGGWPARGIRRRDTCCVMREEAGVRIFAYCTEAAREAVAAATGVEPVASPPTMASQFDVQWLEGYDLIYFRLHRILGRPGWYGEASRTNMAVRGTMYPLALTRVQVNFADLGGAVVVVGNCFSANGDPMVRALYGAGARLVIAGPGENVAAGNRVVGTDLLVKWLIRGMEWGMRAQRALEVARARLALTAWRGADRDAMAFAIVAGGQGDKETRG